MPFAVAMATTSATSALLAKRLGIRNTLTAGLLLVAAGLAALGTSGPGTPFAAVAACIAVVGLGMGMMMAPASLQITSSVPVEYASMAGSLNSVIRELGGVLGIAVLGTIVSSAYRDTMTVGGPAGHDLPSAHLTGRPDVVAAADKAFTDAMDRGVWVAAAIALLAAAAMFIGLRARTSPPVGEPAEVAASRDSVSMV
jgi:fucose permease